MALTVIVTVTVAVTMHGRSYLFVTAGAAKALALVFVDVHTDWRLERGGRATARRERSAGGSSIRSSSRLRTSRGTDQTRHAGPGGARVSDGGGGGDGWLVEAKCGSPVVQGWWGGSEGAADWTRHGSVSARRALAGEG